MNNRKRKPLCSKSDSELEGSTDNDNIFKLYFEKGSLQDYYRKYGDEDDSEIDQNLKLCRKSSCCAFKNDFFKELVSPTDHLKKSIIGLGDADGEFYQEQEIHMFYDSCYCSPCYSPCSPCGANNCCVPRCLSPLPPYIPVPIADCYPKKPKEEQRKPGDTGVENLDGEKKPGILGSIFGKIQSSVSAIKGSMSSMSAMLSKSKMGSKMMGSKTGGGPSSAMGEPMTAHQGSGGQPERMTSRTGSGFRKSSMGTGGGWADEDLNKSKSHYGSGIGSQRSHGWLAGSSSTKVKSNEWGAYMMDRTIFNKPKKVKDAFLKVRFNNTAATDQEKMTKKDYKPVVLVKDENSNFILPKRKSNDSKKKTNLWTEVSGITPAKSEYPSSINHYYSQKYGHTTRSKYSQKSKKDYVDEKKRLKTIRQVYKHQDLNPQNHPYDNDYFLESEINKSFKNSSTIDRNEKKNRIRFYNSDYSSDDDGRGKGGLFYQESIKSDRKSLKPSRNHHNFSNNNNERNESFNQKDDKFSDYFAPSPAQSHRQRNSTSTNTTRNKRTPLKHHKMKDPWNSIRINEYESNQQQQRNYNESEQIERPRPRNRIVKPPTNIYQKDYSISDNLRNISRNIPELLQLHQRISSIESLAPLLRINNSINYQCSQNFNLNIQQNDYENNDSFDELYESNITQAYESQQVLQVIKEPKRKVKQPEIKYLYSKSKSKSKGKKESSSKNYKKSKNVVHFSENIQDQKIHHHHHNHKEKNKSKKDTSKSKSFNSAVKSLFYLWKRS